MSLVVLICVALCARVSLALSDDFDVLLGAHWSPCVACAHQHLFAFLCGGVVVFVASVECVRRSGMFARMRRVTVLACTAFWRQRARVLLECSSPRSAQRTQAASGLCAAQRRSQ